MGMPTEATPEERAQRRRLARAIYDAVVNDEESPLTAEENRDDLAFGLAQECIDLERERDQYDGERRTFYRSFAMMSDSRRRIANAARAVIKGSRDDGDGPAVVNVAAVAELRAALDAVTDPSLDTWAVPNDDIETAIDYMRRASKGPAQWTLPVTGRDKHPLLGFIDTLYPNDLDSDGVQALREDTKHVLDRYELDIEPLHGVSIPVPGETVDDIRDGGDHLVLAITGNGPTSEVNARAIALAFEPVIGYQAMLLEVLRLREENAGLRSTASLVMKDGKVWRHEDLVKLQQSAAQPRALIVDAEPASPSKRWANGAIDDLAETIRRAVDVDVPVAEFERALATLVSCAKMDARPPITREDAVEIAVRHAKAQAPSYYAEPFEPHEWVVRAVMEAGAR